MGSPVEHTLDIATSAVIAIAVIVNCIGICLLQISKVKKTAQFLIIKNLSAADLVLAIGWLGELIIRKVTNSKSGRFYAIWWSLRAGVYLAWYGIIYMLTLDRFIGCNFAMKHKIYIRPKYVRIALIASWIVSVVFGIIGCPFDSAKVRNFYRQYVWTTLDIIFLNLFVVTYVSIFVHLARRRITGKRHMFADNQRFLTTVTALLVAFLLFEATPTITSAIIKQDDEWRKIRDFLYTIILVCDPFIYVFLQPDIRKFALSKLCAFCRRKQKSYGFQGELDVNTDANNK